MAIFKNISRNIVEYKGYIIETETNEENGIQYVSWGVYKDGIVKCFFSPIVYKASTYDESDMVKRAKNYIDKKL